MKKTMLDVLIPEAVFEARQPAIRKVVDRYKAHCITSLDDPVFGLPICSCLLFEHPKLLTTVGIGPLSREEFAYNHFWRHLMLSRLWMLLHGYNAPFADRDLDLIEAIDRCKEKDWDIVQEMCDAADAIFDKSEGNKKWSARYYPESIR